MTRFELLRWRELAPQDRGAWDAFRAADPGLRSPYFDLAWCDAVDRARGDLHVLRASDGSGVKAFLPFHPGLLGSMRPAGGTFCDWHGFVAAPDAAFDAPHAIGPGMAALRFSAAPAGDRLLAPFAESRDASNLMDLSGGFEAYARPNGRAAPKAMSELRRALRKLEADGRRWRFSPRERDPAVLEALLGLKSAQYRRTGHTDVLGWAWSRRLLQRLTETRTPRFEAPLSALWIDDELAAVHLGLRSGNVLHYWMPAYEQRFAAYAPGHVLALEIARSFAAEGVTEVDLGPGHSPWKRQASNASAPMIGGVVHAASTSGRIDAAVTRMLRGWSALPLGAAAGLPHRVLRRLDRELGRFAAAPG